MVAAGSLVPPNTTVPTGEIWAGNPARKLRALDADEAEFILQSAADYSALARIHAAENAKTHEEVEVSCLSCKAAEADHSMHAAYAAFDSRKQQVLLTA